MSTDENKGLLLEIKMELEKESFEVLKMKKS